MENKQNNIIINYCNFNNTKDCIFCGTQEGIIIYDIEPFRLLLKKRISGGINIGTIYKKSNIFFLVGSGINPDYPPNRIIIWNESKKTKICCISINEKIEDFKIISDKILIYSKKRAYIYDFDTLKVENRINIVSHSLSCYINDSNYLIVHPLIEFNNIGNICIKTLSNKYTINSHANPVEKISISHNGNYIITCSCKGQLIKLFNSNTNQLIKTFHRGYNTHIVTYLGFSDNDNWVICATLYGSVHLFNINNVPTLLDNFLRQRSEYSYKINDIIIDCVYKENENKIYFNSLYKFYSGNIENRLFNIKQSQILLIENDPFSLSPKYLKTNIKIK